ncbi:MAG: M28 family peptidase [Gemmataceae bacterium]|nr:M28 family peptidase [Gemmataceae bacterium]
MSPRQWSAVLRLGALVSLLALVAPWASASNEEIEARMRRDITYLASAECEGRGVNTKGIHKAADYIADQFKKAGLKPGGRDGSWFQPFTISIGAAKLEGKGSLVLTGPQGQQIELKPGTHFEVAGGSGGGKVSAPLVFAGYGVASAEEKYFDYKDLDVKGKIVVLIRRVPRWDSKDAPFAGKNKQVRAALLPKFAFAQANRAAAVLLVNDVTDEATGDALQSFGSIPSQGGVVIPVMHVRRAVLDDVLRSSLGQGLRELERDIARDLKPRSAPLAGWSARVDAPVTRPSTPAKNVIAVLEGAGPLADETVVIGAHYDHLGYGEYGSLSKNRGKKEIHHGADDNASGTTAVIELARRFAAIKNRQGRRLVFMTFSGEELGLLGSRHYCEREPLFPLEKTVAMLNLDMVGRLRDHEKVGKDRLIVEGVQTAKGFDELIEKFNEKHKFSLTKRPGNSGYSDHASFYRKQVPVMFLWTDTHPEYHRPTDTAERINVEGMRRITDLAERLVKHFQGVQPRPEHVAITGGKVDPIRPKGKVTLGIVPEYSGDDKKPGLGVGQVAEGRPAAKAGIKAGDLIVELNGKAVRNITDYTAILQSLQAGQTVEVVVMRGDKRLTLKVMLQ